MTGPRLERLLAGAILAAGVLAAFGRRWVCDDTFISLRYAQNLVRGHGLVFNAGERVEGFTNLLWTLWLAVGLQLGANPEVWAVASGLACHAGTLVVVFLLARRLSGPGLPVALLLAAVAPDLAIWATGGLETSLFTLLATLGVLLVVGGRPTTAGVVVAAAALARPDGVLFAAVGLAGVAWLAPPGARLRAAARFAAGFAALFGPVTVWRVSYYDALLPNTYYAKGAYRAWWSQGLAYLGLSAARWWPLAVGLVLALVAAARRHARRREVTLVLAFAVVYATYVVRVGGDFMLARLLVPILPLLAVLFDVGLKAATARPALLGAGAVAAAAALVLTPPPVTGTKWRRGVADEWDVYVNVLGDWPARRRDGATLAKYVRGLPVRLAFAGQQARMVYYSGVATAIESETGLTDARIAHQPLPSPRGRVGHEKHATAAYLVRERRAHLAFNPQFLRHLGVDELIPDVPITLDGLRGRLLTWDPTLVAALRARGARIPDVPGQIDAYLAQLDRVPLEQLRRDYARLRVFYFEVVADPEREARFRARLEGPAPR